MNEIIKIDSDNKVSGRELHEFLEVGTAYKDWFPRMAEYGFVEGTDFCSKMSESIIFQKRKIGFASHFGEARKRGFFHTCAEFAAERTKRLSHKIVQ